MVWILSLMYILGCGRCMGRMVLHEDPEHSFQHVLRELTRDIVRGYFGDFKCVATVSDTPYAVRDSGASATSTVNVVLDGPDGSAEQLMVSALDADCQGFVIRCADASAALGLLLTAVRRAVRRTNLRPLLLPVDRSHQVNTSDVFALEGIKLVPDILVARALDDGERFTGETTWRDELAVARWFPGTGLDPPLTDPSPRRLTNLEGRRMVFATFHDPPWAVLEGGPGTPDGSEMRIAIEFSNKVNASWVVTAYNVDWWGEVWEHNGSASGIQGAVVKGAADVAFAGLSMWLHKYRLMDFSRPYLRSAITCLAPRPLVRPGWQVPLLPFSSYLWATVGISVLLATLALFAIKMATTRLLGSGAGTTGGRYSTVGDCFFRSVGLLVLQAPDLERSHTSVVGPTGHVLTWLLITYVLVTSIYIGGLSSVITVPRYDPPIDTVSDLHQSGLEWAETYIGWRGPLCDQTEEIFRDLCQRFRLVKEDDLRARITTRNLAFPMERLLSGYFSIGDHIDEEAASRWLRPMREDLYWDWVVMVVPKRWPHLSQLDALIDRLVESGLLLVWEGQVSRQWLSRRVQLAVQAGAGARAASPSGDAPVQVRLSHVQGGFALLALGLCLSLAAFAAELVAHRCSAADSVASHRKPERRRRNARERQSTRRQTSRKQLAIRLPSRNPRILGYTHHSQDVVFKS